MSVVVSGSAPAWAADLARQINQSLSTIPIATKQYTVATLPAAKANSGHLVRVADGDAGSPCLAISNGSSWKRIALGADVSVT